MNSKYIKNDVFMGGEKVFAYEMKLMAISKKNMKNDKNTTFNFINQSTLEPLF